MNNQQILINKNMIYQEMVDWLVYNRKSNLCVNTLRNNFINKFPNMIDIINSNFTIASMIDDILYGISGDYWRTAFKFPYQGDKVLIKCQEIKDGPTIEIPMIVSHAGLFTFSVNVPNFYSDSDKYK